MKIELYGHPKHPDFIIGIEIPIVTCDDCRKAYMDTKYPEKVEKFKNEGYECLGNVDFGGVGEPDDTDERNPLYPYRLMGLVAGGCSKDELKKALEAYNEYCSRIIAAAESGIKSIDELKSLIGD